eukprot:6479879-Pyramimonas_sp.AAC.1
MDDQGGAWRCSQPHEVSDRRVVELAIEQDQHALVVLQVEARQHPRRLEGQPEPCQQLPPSENSSRIISTHSERRQSVLGVPHHVVDERVHHDAPQRARRGAALRESAGDASEVHQCVRQLHEGCGEPVEREH